MSVRVQFFQIDDEGKRIADWPAAHIHALPRPGDRVHLPGQAKELHESFEVVRVIWMGFPFLSPTVAVIADGAQPLDLSP